MAAHLGLILETIEAINSDRFDFKVLELPKEFEDEIREKITRSVKTNYEKIKTYTYLHDLGKPDCMNIENGEGKQRVFTLKEWRELVDLNKGDKERAITALSEQGYTKIGYRIGRKLAEELGIEVKDHGDEGVRILQSMASSDEEMERFLEDSELILKGIANHELHFQVFNNAKSAGIYKKFLSSNFSEDEIDFIYTVCLIDITGSLDKNGQSNFEGFRNMVVARECHNLIKNSGLKNVESLLNLDSIEKVKEGIERLRKEELLKEIKLGEADVVIIIEQSKSWGVINEVDKFQLQKSLNEAIGKDNPILVIGQILPNNLKRYIKNIKGYLESKITG
jgi:hypothetical protein